MDCSHLHYHRCEYCDKVFPCYQANCPHPYDWECNTCEENQLIEEPEEDDDVDG